MATSPYGRAVSTSLGQFNEQVQRLLIGRPDPKKAAARQRSWSPKTARTTPEAK